MIFHRYQPSHQDDCLRIYDSNCPKYFLPEERPDFVAWLNKHEAQPFWVVEHEGSIIGCGGVFLSQPSDPVDFADEVGFAWGMVERSRHRQGFGKALTQHRLHYLNQHHPNRPIVLRTSQHVYPFFQKLGFVVHQMLPNGFGQNMDKYIMVHQPHSTSKSSS